MLSCSAQSRTQIILAFTIVFTNAFFISSYAQYSNYSFENISGIQAISENSVSTIIQDKTGFIWIGSANGLIKFDGYNAITYHHKADDPNSVADDEISALCADDEGNLWIGTQNGLSRYNIKSDRFENFFHDSSIASSLTGNQIHGLAKDKGGNIWIAIYGGGLDVTEKKDTEISVSETQYNFRHYRHNEKDSTTISTDNAFSVCFDKQGNAWIGTDDGLNFYNTATKKITRLYHDPLNQNSIANTSIYKLFAANDGSVWICGRGILDQVIQQKKDYTYSFAIIHWLPLVAPGENLANWNINGFMIDQQNNGWIATNDFGLIKFSFSNTRNIFNVEKFEKNEFYAYSLTNTIVNEIFEDKSGIIWIGTMKGISKYIPSKNIFNEALLTYNQQLNRNFYTICEDNHYRFWLGYDSDTIMIVERKQNKNVIKKIKLPGSFANILDQVNVIFKSSVGNIYIGTLHQGIFIFSAQNDQISDHKNWKHFSKENSPQLITTNIYSFAEDSSKNIWIGTYRGVYKYTPVSKKLEPVYIAPDGKLQPAYMINSLCVDQNNLIWCGTGNGLYVIKDGKLVQTYKFHTGDSTSLSNDQVSSITQDRNKNIWVSTKAGINLFVKETNSFKRIVHPDNIPRDAIKILQEDKDGNLWIGLNNGLAKYDRKENKVYTYSTVDGLCSNQFQQNASCIDENGIFYFGTDKGIVSFDPGKVKPNNFIPPIVITNIKILNKDIFSLEDTMLTGTYRREQKLALKYNQNFFSFEFAALNYINSNANQYAYKLEGIDKDWIQSGTKRFADYTDIKPGNYTFKVKGSNNDGIWNEVPATVAVTILPPWWQTWWFYTLCFITVSAIVYLIYRVRVKQILKLYKLRSSIAKDLHDDVGSALSSISLLSRIANDGKTNARLNPDEIFSRIGDTSKRMIDLMDDIVWSVNPDNDRFSNMLIRMREYAVEMLEAKNIDFTFKVSEAIDELKIPMEMRKDYFLIFKESINNLVKYAECNNAAIVIERNNRNIVTTIHDNGKGFDPQIIHSRNGLKNMQARAITLKGKLNIDTAIGKGTTVTLTIPVI